jgi:hypothetical protein
MPFSRSAQSDRRRRVMREAVAADASFASESVRARRKRTLERQLGEEADLSRDRNDPGYSQAVRRACQQRLVQLIPVRRSRLWMAIGMAWLLWSGLLVAHYFIHIRSTLPIADWPVSYLLHLRSPHGIAHWLGSQLWMLTGLAAFMVFQLRKHKLDDYRAKYRLWAVLALAAWFSSLDVSSSALYLLGRTLDPWTTREIGYSGWTLVLASFAAVIGVLGLRLCSELKVAPLGLIFWLTGLIAWASSALLGTGLVKSPWESAMTDLIVGGTWLGGILAVFLAAGIYLRHIYMEAQRRFIMRQRLVQSPSRWSLPLWKRQEDFEAAEGLEGVATVGSRTTSEARRGHEEDDEDLDEDEDAAVDGETVRVRRRFRLPAWPVSWRRKKSPVEAAATESERDTPSKPQPSKAKAEFDKPRSETPAAKKSATTQSWWRLPRWRSDPKLGEDYSDIAAEKRVRDQGFDQPMPKKAGWFAKKFSKPSPQSEAGDSSKSSASRSAADRSTSTAEATTKRRWFQRKAAASARTEGTQPAERRKFRWIFRRGKQAVAVATPKTVNPKKPKFSLKFSQWFSFLEGLKLKPPSKTPAASPAPSAFPSSSAAQRHEAMPVSSASADDGLSYDEDEDNASGSYRGLSKAERKRLKRQQQENRRAA